VTGSTYYMFWLMPFIAFFWEQDEVRPLDVVSFPSLVYAYMHAQYLLREHPQATTVYFRAYGDEEFYEQTRPA
jgi:hypothetical protein